MRGNSDSRPSRNVAIVTVSVCGPLAVLALGAAAVLLAVLVNVGAYLVGTGDEVVVRVESGYSSSETPRGGETMARGHYDDGGHRVPVTLRYAEPGETVEGRLALMRWAPGPDVYQTAGSTGRDVAAGLIGNLLMVAFGGLLALVTRNAVRHLRGAPLAGAPPSSRFKPSGVPDPDE
ncbi:hypothetical protein E1281_36875 [Actinomadura sp. KC345]|uniref:hypothetical protein n=1 Tax=Actinomadura sp. KC345 TaxID=2530371 RepID=UPI00104F468D|nr:hypothetical protein [Actinomadura sp. KC345]TDC41883.1 hypothetical protein E1281_36875 [Actinomadura sp. KC345]